MPTDTGFPDASETMAEYPIQKIRNKTIIAIRPGRILFLVSDFIIISYVMYSEVNITLYLSENLITGSAKLTQSEFF